VRGMALGAASELLILAEIFMMIPITSAHSVLLNFHNVY
jgi:hypothetical protein